MNSTIKALIVDDERLARKELRSLLRAYSHIEVLSEADTIRSTITAMQMYHPDVIFLDIQLHGESGFDLFEKADVRQQVIFVTAYDTYSIRAFEVNALDYLLKPVHPQRLAKSVERLNVTDSFRTANHRLAYTDKLLLKIDGVLKFVTLDTIACIRAAGDYSEIITVSGKKGLVLRTLRAWQAQLPPSDFLRIHRATIVNLNHIDRILLRPNHTFDIYLHSPPLQLNASRRATATLKKVLVGNQHPTATHQT